MQIKNSRLSLIKIANIYRKNLARLGIDAVIQTTTDQVSHRSRLQYGDFDLAYFSFPPAGEVAQWIEQFSTNTQKKYQASDLFGLSDPQLDDLIKQARSSTDKHTDRLLSGN